VRAGASDAIHHGLNGLLLQDPNNSEELAGHIAALRGDSALRKRLGDAGQMTAQNYGWDKSAAQLKEFLLNAAAAKRSRSQS
jgi:glycosyltransferase involved in cell wall biosynthesis